MHVDSWRSTYNGIISDTYLNRMSYEKRTKSWLNNMNNPEDYIVVAENESGEIIGFADGYKRESNLEEDSGDLTSIYLLKDYQGKGIGEKLLHAIFSHFQDMGYKSVFVEVLAANNSRYFYEKMGATLVETKSIIIQGEELSLLIYHWNHIDDLFVKS